MVSSSARETFGLTQTLTIAIGDIHGQAEKLVALLRHCEFFSEGRPAKFVFLGDYVDRGPRSREVIEILRSRQSCDPENVICLMGNHEDLLLRAAEPDCSDADLLNWLFSGGEETLESYGVLDPLKIPPEHLQWMKNLRLSFSENSRVFVHAGLRPDVPLAEQARHDLLWIRKPFLSFSGDYGAYVVHGHTPVQAPDVRSNRANLDTGAGWGRRLTAAFFSKKTRPTLLVNDLGQVFRPKP